MVNHLNSCTSEVRTITATKRDILFNGLKERVLLLERRLQELNPGITICIEECERSGDTELRCTYRIVSPVVPVTTQPQLSV